MISLIIICVISYLVGSIPTAVIVSRIILKDDIRKYGSYNAGATNVFRVMGWKSALFVILVDVGKGLFASLVVSQIRVDPLFLHPILIQLISGVSAVFGHIWTLFAHFKGGKGVGTAFGALLGIVPIPAGLAFIIWLTLILTIRIVSVGSMVAALIFPILLFLQNRILHTGVPNEFLYISFLFPVIIIITHRSNIRRLIQGKENQFGSEGRNVKERNP